MAQGFVGTGGPGRMNVTGPGFSTTPGVQLAQGPDYSNLMKAEQAYLPKLQKWAQSQQQPSGGPTRTDMINAYNRSLVAGGGGGGYSAPQAPRRPAPAPMQASEPMMRQFTSYIPGGPGMTGGKQSYWAFGPKGPNDFASGLTVPASAMGPSQTQVAQGPGVSGASLHPMMPAGGVANLPQATPDQQGQDWQSINPGVRTRMMGAMYDEQYGVSPEKATPAANWSQAYFGGGR